MKLYLKEITHLGGFDGTPFDILDVGLLTVGEIYDGEKTPVMYDPNTLQPVPPTYIIKCNDDKWRKVDASFFMTLEEFRSWRLNEIGI